MASIPCAAYQASHIHGNIRKQRRISGDSSNGSPPSSPQRKGFTPEAVVIRMSSLWPKHEIDSWQPGLYVPDSCSKSFTEALLGNMMGPLKNSAWPWSFNNGPQPTAPSISEQSRNKNERTE